MKINLENMKKVAKRLDHVGASLDGLTKDDFDVTVDDVCNMAYQLQYFFEAMEKLKLLPGTSWADADTVYKIIDLFDSALIEKE